MALQSKSNPASGYPEDESGDKQASRRQRFGSFWAIVFMGSTLVGIIAALTFVLHLATGAVLYRSHASPIAPTVVGAAGDRALCVSEAKPLERALPYD